MSSDKDELKETEFLKWQLEYVIDQIKMADNKINFLLAIYLVLLGIVASQIEKVTTIFLNNCICFTWKVIIGIICALLLGCICKFFYYFINTIKPRTISKEILEEKDYESLIFWKDIANMEYNNFKNATLKSRLGDFKKQVFINSSIAKTKFENVVSAYKVLILTLIFLSIFVGIIHLIGGQYGALEKIRIS